jgi:hypothetical protein
MQPDEFKLLQNSQKAVKEQPKDSPEEHPNRSAAKVDTMVNTELENLVLQIVQREIKRQFEKVAISPIPKTGKTGKRAIKKAFSLPADLWEEVEAMFPGEVMSNVIAAAIRMYLNWRKELDQQTGRA